MTKKDNEEKMRVFIDLKTSGNAKGGLFMKNKIFHKKIIEIELPGVEKVVGIVYDETDKIEFITKSLEEIKLLEDNKILK